MTNIATPEVKTYTGEELMIIQGEKFYTLQEVAKLLVVSERSIYRYIGAGKLKATKIGHWRITNTDLDEFLNNGLNIAK